MVRNTVLVTVLGLEGEALAGVVATAAAECARTGTRPLFVTHADDFRVFREQRLLFEQVVDPDVCAARQSSRDWQSYALQQYRLIGRKWQPVTAITFGRQPDSTLLDAVMQGARQPL